VRGARLRGSGVPAGRAVGRRFLTTGCARSVPRAGRTWRFWHRVLILLAYLAIWSSTPERLVPKLSPAPHAGRTSRGTRRWLRTFLPAILVLVWLGLAAVGGPLFGRVEEVSSNDATAFLPT